MSQTEKDNYRMISLICGMQKTEVIETESRLVVARDRGGEGEMAKVVKE